jgi:hypothetical protein
MKRNPAFELLRATVIMVSGVIVFLGLLLGLGELARQVLPTTSEGTTADIIKTWAMFLLIVPFSGFVTAVYWQSFASTSQKTDRKPEKCGVPPWLY